MTTMSHDAIVRSLLAVRRAITPTRARDAFLASLGSASLRFRTVLAHFAFATHLPKHAFHPSLGDHSYQCSVCGLGKTEDVDAAEHAASRAKGDFALFDPVGAMLDLHDFANGDTPVPSNDDIDVFDRMLAVIAALPEAARATALVKAWSFVPRTNKYARENLIATLGACGLFETIDHPGHMTRFVSLWEYEEAPGTANDMRTPEAWWTRADGVDRTTLERLFKHPRIDTTRFPKRAWKRVPVNVASKVGKLALAPGDRIGIRYLGRHFVGVVIGAHQTPKATIPVVEMYRDTWDAWPTEKQLRKGAHRLVGPHATAPSFRREPLALAGLHLYGKVMAEAHVEVLARGCKPPGLPSGARLPLPPTGYRVIAPQSMLSILETLATPMK